MAIQNTLLSPRRSSAYLALLAGGMFGLAAPAAWANCPPGERCNEHNEAPPAAQRPAPQAEPGRMERAPQPAAPHPTAGMQTGQYPGAHEPPRPGGPEGRGYGALPPRGVAPERMEAGPHYTYRGRSFAPITVGRYNYPRGYHYARYGIGYRLPLAFVISSYFILDWAAYGLAPPPYPGYQWVRVGPDMLLVDTATGQVVDAVYGGFVEVGGY